MIATQYFTPPQLAKRLAVSPAKIVGWIEAGELRGTNLATKRDGCRPRYRVSEEDLAEFLNSRSGSLVAPTKPRRRRKALSGVTEFF
jgi:excisionase family DNA binding protein